MCGLSGSAQVPDAIQRLGCIETASRVCNVPSCRLLSKRSLFLMFKKLDFADFRRERCEKRLGQLAKILRGFPSSLVNIFFWPSRATLVNQSSHYNSHTATYDTLIHQRWHLLHVAAAAVIAEDEAAAEAVSGTEAAVVVVEDQEVSYTHGEAQFSIRDPFGAL